MKPEDRDELHQLLRRLQEANDRGALCEIIDKTQDRVFRYARLLAGNDDLASDLTQGAFLALTRGYGRIESDVLAWLKGVVRTSLRAHFRAVQKRQAALQGLALLMATPEGQPSILEKLLDEEYRQRLGQRLGAALRSLPPRRRECIRLRYLEQRGYDEIAEEMGVAVSSAHSYCCMGLRELRARMAWEEEE